MEEGRRKENGGGKNESEAVEDIFILVQCFLTIPFLNRRKFVAKKCDMTNERGSASPQHNLDDLA